MAELIKEGCLSFSFPDKTVATKYDDWAFYRNQFCKAFDGIKAIDIVHVDADRTAWLIEVKDYRAHPRTKPSDLSEEIALKVHYTLAGLVAARFHAQDINEKKSATAVLQAKQLKIVLHLEQPHKPSKLFPQVVNPAAIKQRLKTLLKAVDAHPAVVDRNNLKITMNWTVVDTS